MLRARSPRLRAVRRLGYAGALAALACLATASVALGADPDSMFGAPFDSSATLAMAAATPRSLPSGFTDTAVWTGLTLPTSIRWAPDGRVFVSLKSGIIDEFDSMSDPTPTVYADLRNEVYNESDRGLLSI